ncbi:MAG: bifunctional serine/threonine-protein kinase/formylglycine-generating enzyme family protein [Lentisphaeria bacterium]|nr:bifunctional serine/threonine-protein kinase/formylglycine-generating enzyme family protein [Lentisphaeria bacterium]
MDIQDRIDEIKSQLEEVKEPELIAKLNSQLSQFEKASQALNNTKSFYSATKARAKIIRDQIRAIGIEEGVVLENRFELKSFLGASSIGTIFAAFDTVRQSKVAIQVLIPELTQDPQSLQLFLEEANQISSLAHTNIIKMHDVHKHGEIYFQSMALLKGYNLRQRMEIQKQLKEPFGIQEVNKIVTSLLTAINHAHEKGIIHRDIRPENIFLCEDGEVVLLNFGVANLIKNPNNPNLIETIIKEYSAPEEFDELEDVTASVDLYSIGAILYELLTSKLPVGRFKSASQLVQCPLVYSNAADRALSAAPEERFPNAEQFLKMLPQISSKQQTLEARRKALKEKEEDNETTVSVGSKSPLITALKLSMVQVPKQKQKKASSAEGLPWFKIISAIVILFGIGLGVTSPWVQSQFKDNSAEITRAEKALTRVEQLMEKWDAGKFEEFELREPPTLKTAVEEFDKGKKFLEEEDYKLAADALEKSAENFQEAILFRENEIETYHAVKEVEEDLNELTEEWQAMLETGLITDTPLSLSADEAIKVGQRMMEQKKLSKCLREWTHAKEALETSIQIATAELRQLAIEHRDIASKYFKRINAFLVEFNVSLTRNKNSSGYEVRNMRVLDQMEEFSAHKYSDNPELLKSLFEYKAGLILMKEESFFHAYNSFKIAAPVLDIWSYRCDQFKDFLKKCYNLKANYNDYLEELPQRKGGSLWEKHNESLTNYKSCLKSYDYENAERHLRMLETVTQKYATYTEQWHKMTLERDRLIDGRGGILTYQNLNNQDWRDADRLHLKADLSFKEFDFLKANKYEEQSLEYLLKCYQELATRISFKTVSNKTGLSLESSVFVNGIEKGKTPCTIELTFGKIVQVSIKNTEQHLPKKFEQDLSFRGNQNQEHKLDWTPWKNEDVKISKLSLTLKPIRFGSFKMGTPQEAIVRDQDEVVRDVDITLGYWLAEHEVTQEQFESLMYKNPSFFVKGSPRIGNRDTSKLPVEQVTWSDCVKFCQQLTEMGIRDGWLPAGYEIRLPTEAEWEYACRSGSSKYNENFDASSYGWFEDNSRRKPQKVKSKKANEWGIYDMIGNVSEWCMDGYYLYQAGIVEDPKGPMEKNEKVLRGGSFADVESLCRPTNRMKKPSETKSYRIGFRIALAPKLAH